MTKTKYSIDNDAQESICCFSQLFTYLPTLASIVCQTEMQVSRRLLNNDVNTDIHMHSRTEATTDTYENYHKMNYQRFIEWGGGTRVVTRLCLYYFISVPQQ